MLALPKIEPPILFPRPAVVDDGMAGGPWLKLTDHPDVRRNPRLWLKLYLEGITLHGRSMGLARRSERILDLGCGSGWFSIAAARSNPRAAVEAVDLDGRLLDWGRYYADRLRNQGVKMGSIRFSEADVATLPWAEMEEQLDLVHAGFILSRCKDPGEILQGVYRALKPGGWLIYHDATEPPPGNLDQLARLHHQCARWQDKTSDPWGWRRLWSQRYMFDTVRTFARHSDPPESHVVQRLEELFAIRHQERCRSLLDLYLRMGRKKPYRHALLLPVVKLTDDVLTRLGIVQGACRYVLAQKR
jgi:ubiquinone/menaquinone biosynthesis C-methylase UbiE